MDKESYLRRYDLKALTGADDLAKAYCIQRSSAQADRLIGPGSPMRLVQLSVVSN